MLPWYVTGAGLVVLIIVLIVPVFRAGPPTNGAGPDAARSSGPMQSGVGSPPPLSGNMRDNADRLFNRIMQARETGDSAQATQFLPMAISAYQQAAPLDADGSYHLSLLQSYAGQPDAALATAREILAGNPAHLLGLSAAAQAAQLAGREDESRGYYRKILEVYPTESKRSLVEYQDHANVLPAIEAEAKQRVQ